MEERRFLDGKKLAQNYSVQFLTEDSTEMVVDFDGPKDSLYHGFRFKVVVELEEGYPHGKAPVVYFQTRILHPNIDLDSGFCSVCALENEKWTINSNLEHVFSYILPQLLCFPNFEVAYNQQASDLHHESPEIYEQAVIQTCEEYAERI